MRFEKLCTVWSRRGVHRTSFRRVFSADAFLCKYLLATLWVYSLLLMFEWWLRIWHANSSTVECIEFDRQKPSALHPKNLKCLSAKKQALTVDPVPIQKPRTVPPDGHNLLIKCVINNTSFCSRQTRGRLPHQLARRSMSDTGSTNNSIGTATVLWMFNEAPGHTALKQGSSHSITYDSHLSLSAKCALPAQPYLYDEDFYGTGSEWNYAGLSRKPVFASLGQTNHCLVPVRCFQRPGKRRFQMRQKQP